ncbi:Pex13 protein [Apiospora aurea]|uniref:Peroxisomal membrane protein PEX13 n=1 Tax=Apiospora aurea TaxID=335848 RepID=A0ABR1QQX0_9PEZI
MASPPKPWERGGATTSAATMAAPCPTASRVSMPAAPSSLSAAPSSISTATDSSPAIPPRPDSLASSVNQNASAYSRLGSSPYNSAYSSPYNRYGGYGSSMYGGGMGGYGGYGGMGGMGMGGMGGMGGMYGGMYGGGMNPNDPNANSLTNTFNNSTMATFQMLEGIVGAFGGFAQMLESTYMATHSSFFAMVSVAEQFGNLRDTLGSVLGIFTLMRWIRTLIAKITGRPPPADATALTPAAFARPTGKPLVFFLLAAFGLPYVMSRVIRSFAVNQEKERRRLEAANASDATSQLEFCRVLYDFAPQTGAQGTDLAVKKGDFVAVLSKNDPQTGAPSEWWKCRSRDTRVGWLPATFLEVARRPGQPLAAIKAAASEPANTRANSLTSATAPMPATAGGKPSDATLEGFQKSQFYS